MYQNSKKHLVNLGKARKKAIAIKIPCEHCSKPVSCSGLKNHSENCYLNPLNLTLCPHCDEPIRRFKTSKSCSVSCSNKASPKRPITAYRSICFLHHDKKCIICGEENILSVHHVDEDHSNNDPSNLVPLCPTHHQYLHSSFKNMVLPSIHEYLVNWSGRSDSNG